MDDELSPKESARIKGRDRKKRPPKMVVDNAGVRRIQLALRRRAAEKKKTRGKPRDPDKK